MMPANPVTCTGRRARIIISINTSWNIVNFRAGLIKDLQQRGYEIVALSPDDGYSERLQDLGVRHVSLPMDNKGTNLMKDGALFLRYIHSLQRERPDAFLGWTIKPNVYGSLAAHLLGVPTINNVSGLGTAFIRNTWLTRFVKLLYRLAFLRSACVFFQNRDDLALFVNEGLVNRKQARLLPGSGIDLKRFAPPPERNRDAGPVFLLLARLLWDKGIAEYVDAARRVRAKVPGVRFCILGFVDVENRSAIPRQVLEEWVEEGVIDYLGHADDVRPHIAAADCVVLPSYREGTPRSLLEAAAMARPLIATDVPGCREVVEDGVNGWLCRQGDAEDLADKMLAFVLAPEGTRLEMGRQSRLKAERDFAESTVTDSYVAVIDGALEARRGHTISR